MTSKQIDEHLDNWKDIEISEQYSASQYKSISLCAVWAKIGPVVKWLRFFLFIKPKWRKALDGAIASFDSLCDIPR